MEPVICLICPAVVAFLLYEKLIKRKLDYKYSICVFLVLLLCVNTSASIVSRFVFGTTNSIAEAIRISPILSAKYIAVALIFAVLWAIIIAAIEKNISLELVVEKEEKNPKKTEKAEKVKKVKKNAKAKKSSKNK